LLSIVWVRSCFVASDYRQYVANDAIALRDSLVISMLYDEVNLNIRMYLAVK